MAGRGPDLGRRRRDAAALSQAARFCAECETPADGADRARRMRRDLVAGVVRVRR
jgi:hypothetical protein